MKKIQEEAILGVHIAITNMEEVLSFLDENKESISGKYICVSNVHTTVMSYEDEAYKNVQNTACLRIPDGKPLSIVLKKRGYKKAERVTGPDLMEECFKNGKLRHYFYGSTEETLRTLESKLKEKYKDIQIVGMYSPPFRQLSIEEDREIVANIKSANPDIIWVGLGAPKQENWMYEHQNQMPGVMIGVGAGFDYHAGNIKRAPKWMQKLALEWFYRLFQDPKRLFKRYMKTNYKFIKLVNKENKR